MIEIRDLFDLSCPCWSIWSFKKRGFQKVQMAWSQKLFNFNYNQKGSGIFNFLLFDWIWVVFRLRYLNSKISKKKPRKEALSKTSLFLSFCFNQPVVLFFSYLVAPPSFATFEKALSLSSLLGWVHRPYAWTWVLAWAPGWRTAAFGRYITAQLGIFLVNWLLTANFFESGPMPNPWNFLDRLPLLPSCKFG